MSGICYQIVIKNRMLLAKSVVECDSGNSTLIGVDMTSTAFMTGTWYSVEFPDDKNYNLEEIYNQYWMGGLPDDVEIFESEVSHIWRDDLDGIEWTRAAVSDAITALETGNSSADIEYAIARLKSALVTISGIGSLL